MLSEGQTDGEGSKQKQRKKDSHTMGYMIHTVSVYEKLGQLLVMKIFEKKARVLNTSEHPCEIAPPSHFINKSIDKLAHQGHVTNQECLIPGFKFFS